MPAGPVRSGNISREEFMVFMRRLEVRRGFLRRPREDAAKSMAPKAALRLEKGLEIDDEEAFRRVSCLFCWVFAWCREFRGGFRACFFAFSL